MYKIRVVKIDIGARLDRRDDWDRERINFPFICS